MYLHMPTKLKSLTQLKLFTKLDKTSEYAKDIYNNLMGEREMGESKGEGP